MKIPTDPGAKFFSFVVRHYKQLSLSLLLGLLLELFFGYLRSHNIDTVEKSYLIPTIGTYLSAYLAVYVGLSKK